MTIKRMLGKLQRGDVLTDLADLGVVEYVHTIPVTDRAVIDFAGGMQLTGWAGELVRVEPEDDEE